MGNIGEPVKETEWEPIPNTIPVPEIVPEPVVEPLRVLVNKWINAAYSDVPSDQITAAQIAQIKEDLKHIKGVPSVECTCGIYGWYEPEFALEQHSSAVMGVVECTGRILLGTTGFRAQEAKIVAIAPGDTAKIVEYSRNRDGTIHHSMLRNYVRYENGKMVVDYGELNAAMNAAHERTRVNFMEHLYQVGKDYGVEVFESMEALKLIYPPQLDTLENVLEGKLQRYAASS